MHYRYHILRRVRFIDGQEDLRAASHAARQLAWTLRCGPVTDDERLGFHWAVMHVKNREIDLALEDLTWLGARLEAATP